MHNFDPIDIKVCRKPLGGRNKRHFPTVQAPTEAELRALDQAIEDVDEAIVIGIIDVLITRHSATMARAIRRVGIVRRDVIEEAIQDAYLKYHELQSAGARIANPEAWLAMVAQRSAISMVRKQSNRKRLDKERSRSMSMEIGPSEEEAIVRDLLESLPAESRMIVERILKGEERMDIAKELGISPRTIYRRLDDVKERFAPLMLGNLDLDFGASR